MAVPAWPVWGSWCIPGTISPQDVVGHLLGMLTFLPERDWEQCKILTLHAAGQWRGTGTALIEAVG
jgi:hypothetical protein